MRREIIQSVIWNGIDSDLRRLRRPPLSPYIELTVDDTTKQLIIIQEHSKMIADVGDIINKFSDGSLNVDGSNKNG